MSRPLWKSRFSRHFNLLSVLGAWSLETYNDKILGVYAAYKTLMTSVAVYGVYALCVDLYMVFGDFKRITWNLCITTLFAGGLVKNIYLYVKYPTIQTLRINLHKAEESRDAPDDIAIHQLALKELKYLERYFYGGAGVFVPTWLVSRYLSYLWDQREWPIPLRLPFNLDINDDKMYIYGFMILGGMGVVGLALVVETELAMFTILIQILREYRVFLKDIPKLNDLYWTSAEDTVNGENLMVLRIEDQVTDQEVNPGLRKIKTKMLISQFSHRQQKLIEYINAFEVGYSNPLLLQFFVATILVVVSCIQCILEAGDFSASIAYQMGYLSICLMDMFLVCWFATRIRTYCSDVGEAAYSTLWYRMDRSTQKDIFMMIMRSQNPPKITSGKLIEMNLHAFMLLMRNIYSWLALFQQLEFNVKSQ